MEIDDALDNPWFMGNIKVHLRNIYTRHESPANKILAIFPFIYQNTFVPRRRGAMKNNSCPQQFSPLHIKHEFANRTRPVMCTHCHDKTITTSYNKLLLRTYNNKAFFVHECYCSENLRDPS